MQVRNENRGGGEEVHHIRHTWVNSCKEAGFSRVWVGAGGGKREGGGSRDLRTGQIHAES